MTTFDSSDGAATEIPTSLPGAVDEFDRPAAQGGGPRWEDIAVALFGVAPLRRRPFESTVTRSPFTLVVDVNWWPLISGARWVGVPRVEQRSSRSIHD